MENENKQEEEKRPLTKEETWKKLRALGVVKGSMPEDTWQG